MTRARLLALWGPIVADIITIGPVQEIEAALGKIATIWECAGTQILKNPDQEVKFCGFQILRTETGYRGPLQ